MFHYSDAGNMTKRHAACDFFQWLMSNVHSFGNEALHVFQACDRGDAQQAIVRDSLLLNHTADDSNRAQIQSAHL